VDDDQIADERWQFAPWDVDAVRLTPAGAVDLLLALPPQAPTGIAVGDSLSYLAEACKLALELVARGRLRPVLEQPAPTAVELTTPGAGAGDVTELLAPAYARLAATAERRALSG